MSSEYVTTQLSYMDCLECRKYGIYISQHTGLGHYRSSSSSETSFESGDNGPLFTNEKVCRTHDSQNQGQGHTSMPWDLPFNFVSAQHVRNPLNSTVAVFVTTKVFSLPCQPMILWIFTLCFVLVQPRSTAGFRWEIVLSVFFMRHILSGLSETDMVGFTLKKTGVLDTKQPSTATIGRGWRYQAWKERRVELVDNGDNTAELRLYKDEEMVQVIPLEDVKDVRDVASKTHAHAFEVVGGNDRAIIILSGETALESRDWIWSIQKIFRPVDQDGIQDKVLVRLLGTEDTEQLGLPEGEYEFTISVSGLYVAMPTVAGARASDIEPMKNGGKRNGFSLPLTTIGRVSLDTGFTNIVTIETTPDSKCGTACFRVESVDEKSVSTESLFESIKIVVRKATDHLHDLIDNSNWNVT